jgi:hypothetical protein
MFTALMSGMPGSLGSDVPLNGWKDYCNEGAAMK